MPTDPFGREKPLARPAKSRESKRRAAQREQKRVDKAQERLVAVQFLQKLLGEERGEGEQDLTKKDAYALLRQAIADPDTPEVFGEPRRDETYRTWLNRADEWDGPLSVEAFMHRKGAGRPPLPWDDQVHQHALDLRRAGIVDSVTEFQRELEEFTAEYKLPMPTPHQVETLYRSIPLEELVAGRHDAKAARTDAMPKGTVPSDFPHDVWALDELDSPVWIQALDPTTKKKVSVRPKLIAVVDHYSRVILALYVCDPFKGGRTNPGFDQEEVMGTFWSAVLVDLASEPCKPFVGYLPNSVRMDNENTHNGLKARLRMQGIECPRLPKGTPFANGRAEALVGTVKKLLGNVYGHVNKYLPADQVKRDQKDARKKAAATTSRVRNKRVREVEKFLTLAEFREDVEKEVQAYQRRAHDGIDGTAPEVRYHQGLDRRHLREGRDVIYFVEPVVLTAQKRLMHRRRAFSRNPGGREIAVGEQVLCYPDPLLRGLYLKDDDGGFRFLPDLDTAARGVEPGQVAAEQNARAHELAEEAEQARRRVEERREEKVRARRDKKRRAAAEEQRPLAPEGLENSDGGQEGNPDTKPLDRAVGDDATDAPAQKAPRKPGKQEKPADVPGAKNPEQKGRRPRISRSSQLRLVE